MSSLATWTARDGTTYVLYSDGSFRCRESKLRLIPGRQRRMYRKRLRANYRRLIVQQRATLRTGTPVATS